MAAGRIKGITLEIGGDTTKLTSALSKVDRALKTTQSNLNDINKALKLDPSNTALLKDRQAELAKAVSETKERIDKEKEAYNQLAAADRTPENVEKMRQLKTQIDLDTASLKDLESQAREASSVLGTQMQNAGAKIQEVGDKIKGIGDKLSAIGTTLTTRVTAPIVGGFAAMVKTTGDFDAAMSKVQAVSGATADDMILLRDKAKEMGEATKFSASESAEALNYMAMAGWKTEDMLGGISGIMNLAAASGEELGTTSDIVTDALTAFGYKAEDAGRFADILAAASSNANTNVSMMGESFKYAAPVAGALGYSAEDVAVALGLMANSGIKASQAGTSLRNIFQRMAKPTKESAEAMDRLGLSMYDDAGQMYSFRDIMDQVRESMKNINAPVEDYVESLEALDVALKNKELTQKQYEKSVEELNLQTFGAEGAEKARAAAMLGGARAMAGLLAISNATEEDYQKLTAAIDGSSQSFARLADGSVVPLNQALENGDEIIEQYTGAAEAMAGVMLDNMPGGITLLKSKIEALSISFGEMLMPTVEKVIGILQEFVDSLNAMDESQREQIIQIAAIVAAVGPVLLIIGKVVSGVGMIVSIVGKVVSAIGSVISAAGGLQAIFAALTGPIGIVIAIVGALVAAFVYFYNTNEAFREKVLAVWEAIKEGIAAFWEQLQVWFQQFLEWIQPVIDGFIAFGQAIMECVQEIITVITGWLEAHSTEIKMILTTGAAIVKTVFETIKMNVQTAFDVIKTIIMGALNIITNLVKAFTSLLKGDWKGALNYLVQAASSYINMIKQVFQRMVDGIKSVFSNLITNMKNWGREMIESLIGGIKEKISGVGEAIVGGLGKVGEFIGGIGGNSASSYSMAADSFSARSYSAFDRASAQVTTIQAAPVVVNVALEGTADRIFRVVKAEASRNHMITGQAFA